MMFNHFQFQDGVCRSALAIANLVAARNDVEITLIPIFNYEPKVMNLVSDRVKVKPVFRFYFHGFSKLLDMLPKKLLYKLFIGDHYDVNIAFQYGISEKIIASGTHRSHASIGWMHGFDEGMTLKEDYLKMDKMVCVSRCNADRLSAELGGKIPVDYNYNPINDEQVRNQGNMPIEVTPNRTMQFVSVGRMSPEKGFSRLLKVMKQLADERYDFGLWLIGDGSQLAALKQEVQDLNLDNYISFLGKKDNPHAYTSKADVFVCSSFTEGYSTACTEAIMLNVPVISTKVSGAKEIIDEACCGLLVDSNEQALYEGLKQILDHPQIVEKWKETLAVTKYNFSPSKRIKRFLDIVGLK